MRPGIYLLILLFIASCSETNETGETVPAVSVTIAQTEIRDLSDAFTVSSAVTAYRRSYVASRLSGLVEEVLFEEGQSVNQGDLLARLDTRQQQTELKSARAAQEEIRDIYERNSTLFESNAISRAEYLSTERNLQQAVSEVEQLELQIEFGEIKAPIDGVITARLVEPGNNVSVNERMFTVVDLDLLVIRPGISEMNLTGLQEGQPVDIHLDVYPDRNFSGSIRRIFPSVDALTGLFTVEVEVFQDVDQPIIRPGYLARIRFVSDDQREVLTIPSEAVVEREGESFVFLLNSGQDEVTLTPVTIGIQRDGYAEIRDGLERGAFVAAANLGPLNDGDTVRVVGTFRRYGFRN